MVRGRRPLIATLVFAFSFLLMGIGPFRGHALRLDGDHFYFREVDGRVLDFNTTQLRGLYSRATLERLITGAREIEFRPTERSFVSPVTFLSGIPMRDPRDPENFVNIREPHVNHYVDLRRVPAETRRRLVEAASRQTPLEVALPPEVQVRHEVVPYGVRGDCSELPLSYDRLAQLGRSAPDMVSFLRSIPEGTMQNFTLVYESRSAQQEGVDSSWPRVIRFNSTGSLMMSYTCNPASPNYGVVEFIRREPPSPRFQFSEWDYRNNLAAPSVAGQPRVHIDSNPTSCLRCHGNANAPLAERATALAEMRPNWQQYRIWHGVNGSHDDAIVPGSDEARNYTAFREQQRDNPCYSSLPWPRTEARFVPPDRPPTQDRSVQGRIADLELYPYRSSANLRSTGHDYRVRTNLKISDFVGHHLAQTIAQRLTANPRFQPLRGLMMAEAVGGCGIANLDEQIRAILPQYSIRPTNYDEPFNITTANGNRTDAIFDPSSIYSEGHRLYGVSRALGFAPMDWTLTYNEPNSPVYTAGIGAEGGGALGGIDLNLPVLVQTQLMRTLEQEVPELRGLYRIGRGVSRTFGPQFGCVDDLGGDLNLSHEQKKQACEILRHRFNLGTPAEITAVRRYPAPGQAPPPAPAALAPTPAAQTTGAGACPNPSAAIIQPPSLVAALTAVANGIPVTPPLSEVARAGRAVIQARCISCHSSGVPVANRRVRLPNDFLFFSSEDSTRNFFRSSQKMSELREMVQPGISASSRMPPDAELTPNERRDLLNYLGSYSH